MDVDEQIKAMILDNEPLSSIRKYQEKKGSMPLRDHVLRMAATEKPIWRRLRKYCIPSSRELQTYKRKEES